MVTIGQALADARTQLAEVTESPQLEARLLLSEICQQSTAWIFSHPEVELSPEQSQQYAAIIAQRATGYPVAYILGKRGFYHWGFTVTPDVLIPRPETELLVEKAATWAQNRHPEGQGLQIVDVGTGSGIIAISLAHLLPQSEVIAIDISLEALAVAQKNATQLTTPNISFLNGSLLEPLAQNSAIDLIAANLPYIPTDDLKNLDVSRWEPHLALDGGSDGLLLIQQLLQQSHHHLKPSGSLFLEIGANQGFAVTQLAYRIFPNAEINIHQDLAGLDRLVIVDRNH